jgi:hypothetical protein
MAQSENNENENEKPGRSQEAPAEGQDKENP